MFNKLSVESYQIPWLIWIQLIVLFLLFAIFYCFTISDDDGATASISPETSSVSAKSFRFEEIQRVEKPLLTADNDSITPVSTNGQHRDITLKQGGQNLSIEGEIETCSSITSEELLEEEESTLSSHPCNFFQVATLAFLKCFGLDDSTFGSSSQQKRRKRKES
ncbi:unnamed protein product [Vicia faba]|uniref:Uncharacterized protein n=1 Tax=Vicia faba TaxID=3906 RepID=A0AAV0ZS75_VICFA|nr:unnamed protein product [Vicia faba]